MGAMASVELWGGPLDGKLDNVQLDGHGKPPALFAVDAQYHLVPGRKPPKGQFRYAWTPFITVRRRRTFEACATCGNTCRGCPWFGLKG